MGQFLVKGLDTVWCPVTNMDRSIAFYSDTLGLKPGYKSPYWTSFDLGGVQLGLHFGGGEPGGGFVASVLTDNLPALRSKLAEAGGEVGEYHETPRGTVMDFADPDGNRLQAMQLGVKPAELEK